MTEEAKEVEMLFLKSENLILKEMVAIKFQYIKLKKTTWSILQMK
jgi:hypothetical protein